MEKKCSCSRRNFLISSTKAALGAAVCSNLLNSCNKKPVDILGDDEAKLLTLDINLPPELATVGGAVKFSVAGQNPPLTLLIYRKAEREFIVVSAACTHKGIQVELPDQDGVIVCYGDGAKFDIKQGGKALIPSITPMDLKRYDCTLNGNTLTVYQS